MKLLIQGNNIAVTESIHDYVESKLEKATKHFQTFATKVDVHLSVANNARITDKHKAEVTVYANGTVIRAQEGSENLYASIDLVSDKIARQLRKYKEKILARKPTFRKKPVKCYLRIRCQIISLAIAPQSFPLKWYG